MTPGEMIALVALVMGHAGVVVAYLVRIESRLSKIEGSMGIAGPRTRVIDFRDHSSRERS